MWYAPHIAKPAGTAGGCVVVRGDAPSVDEPRAACGSHSGPSPLATAPDYDERVSPAGGSDRSEEDAAPALSAEVKLATCGVPAVGVAIALCGGRRVTWFFAPSLVRLISLALLLTAGYCVVTSTGSAAKVAAADDGERAFATSTASSTVRPGGVWFDLAALLIFSSLVGGSASALCGVPPLVGITYAALLYANMTGTAFELIGGITPLLRRVISRVGLTVILMRAGLAVQGANMAGHALRLVGLSLVPLCGEAMVHGAIQRALMPGLADVSFAWAALLGFMASAVAPSVVVPGVLVAKAEGHGDPSGPFDVLLTAAVLDSALSVWIISFLIDFVLPGTTGRSPALTGALGPIQLVAGAVLGAMLGFTVHMVSGALLSEPIQGMLEAGTPPKSATVATNTLAMALGLGLVFFGQAFTLAGGGAVAVVALTATLSYLWRPQHAPGADAAPPGARALRAALLSRLAARLAQWWDALVLPALFAMLGSSVDVTVVFDGSFLKHTAPALLFGVAVRFVLAVACGIAPALSDLRHWTWGERLWVAASWIGKASVQAALGGVALATAADHLATVQLASTATPQERLDAENAVSIARVVQSVASLAAVVFAPLSALLMRLLSGVCLAPATPAAAE